MFIVLAGGAPLFGEILDAQNVIDEVIVANAFLKILKNSVLMYISLFKYIVIHIKITVLELEIPLFLIYFSFCTRIFEHSGQFVIKLDIFLRFCSCISSFVLNISAFFRQFK